MSTKRIISFAFVLALAVSLLLFEVPAGASDFGERMAAWQGAAPPAEVRMAPPTRSVKVATQRTQGQQLPAAPAELPPPQTPQPKVYNTHAGSSCPNCGRIDAPFDNHVSGDAVISPGYYGNYGGGDSCGGCGSCGSCCGCGPCGGCGLLDGLFGNLFCGCGPCGGCGGYCDDGASCCNTLVWARLEVLMWWRQGRDLPVLATTDPVSESSTTAGILPNAQTLFGGGRVGSDMQAGGRVDVGVWCDPRQCCGYGYRFFGLGQDSTRFDITSLENPVLAIPFVDSNSNVNDALLVAYPGLRSGEIHVLGNSSIIGSDIYTRILLCRDCNCRIDFITGWNYSRINDEVQIHSRQTVTETGGNIPVGTVTDILDGFQARNEFNGGILGLLWERQCGCWDTRVLARMSLGNMHERHNIDGSTTIAEPGQAVQTSSGGLFTAASNIGASSRDEFTAITEIGVNFGYHWGPCTQLTVGYSFLYWNDILTAASAIDTSRGTGRPQFAFQHSDFWVQGINLGVTKQF